MTVHIPLQLIDEGIIKQDKKIILYTVHVHELVVGEIVDPSDAVQRFKFIQHCQQMQDY